MNKVHLVSLFPALCALIFTSSCVTTKRDNPEAPLALDIPRDWEYQMLPGEEYEVYEIRPKSGSKSTLGIYLGRNPQIRIAPSTQAVTIPIGPEKRDTLFWQDSRGGRYVLQGVIDNFFAGTKDKNLAQQKMHILVSAAEPGFSDTALDVLQTLRRADGVSMTAANSSNVIDPVAQKEQLLQEEAARQAAAQQQDFESSFREQVQEFEGPQTPAAPVSAVEGSPSTSVSVDTTPAATTQVKTTVQQTVSTAKPVSASSSGGLIPVNETEAASSVGNAVQVLDQQPSAGSVQTPAVLDASDSAGAVDAGSVSTDQLQRIRDKINNLRTLESSSQ